MLYPERGITWYTTQKMKFSIKDFFSKCDQIRRKLLTWSHSPNKSLMENLIFCAVYNTNHIKSSMMKVTNKNLVKACQSILQRINKMHLKPGQILNSLS